MASELRSDHSDLVIELLETPAETNNGDETRSIPLEERVHQMRHALKTRDDLQVWRLLRAGVDVKRRHPDTKRSLIEECFKFVNARALHLIVSSDFVCAEQWSLNKPNEHFDNMAPIHMAVQTPECAAFFRTKSLHALLRIPNLRVDLPHWSTATIEPARPAAPNGLTPLQQLCLRAGRKRFAFKDLELLLQCQANVNMPIEGRPLIVHVAESAYRWKRAVIEVLLASGHVYLDGAGGAARRCLAEMYPGLRLPPAVADSDRDWSVAKLRQCIEDNDDKRFQFGFSLFMAARPIGAPFHEDEQVALDQILHSAIEHGMLGAVRLLLRNGAAIGNVAKCVCAAVRGGNVDVLAILLRLPVAQHDWYGIFYGLRKLQQTDILRNEGSCRCYQLLLGDPRCYGNVGEILLENAVSKQLHHEIGAWLKGGHYLGAWDQFGHVYIESIDANTIEDQLNCSITVLSDSTEQCLVFNYSSLRPKTSMYQFDYPESLDFLLNSKHCDRLITHPLITSYMHLKWLRIRNAFHLNLLVVFLFGVAMTAYVHLYYVTGSGRSSAVAWTLFAVSVAGTMVLLAREGCQLVTRRRQYFRDVANYLELALVTTSAFILCADVDEPTRRTAAALSTLLLFGEMFLLVSFLPLMSLHINLYMLVKVFGTVVRHMLLYAIMLFAFALSFFTVSHRTGGSANQTTATGAEDTNRILVTLRTTIDSILANRSEADAMSRLVHGQMDVIVRLSNRSEADASGGLNKFGSLGMSLLKVLVMMTGEFEADDMDLSSVFGCMLLVFFMLLFSVSIFNLLTGLAVSDIQLIRSEAEITYLKHRAQRLSYDQHSELRKYLGEPLGNWYKSLLNRIGVSHVTLFPDYLENSRVFVLLNQNHRMLVSVESQQRFMFNFRRKPVPHFVNNDVLDAKIVRQALAIAATHGLNFHRLVEDACPKQLGDREEMLGALLRHL